MPLPCVITKLQSLRYSTCRSTLTVSSFTCYILGDTMQQQSRLRITLGILALAFFVLLVYSTAPRIVQAATGGPGAVGQKPTSRVGCSRTPTKAPPQEHSIVTALREVL